jgi:hypothetical protein
MTKSLIAHPFLFAIFPVVFLFARNVHLFHPGVIMWPMSVATSLALVAWITLSVSLKDKRKAGLITSLFFLLFFSYESLFAATKDFIGRVDWIEHSMVRMGVTQAGVRASLLLISASLFALGAYSLARTRRSMRKLTNIANVVACALVLISLIDIAAYQVRTRSAWQEIRGAQSIEPGPATPEEPGTFPNIFYIILDGYAGADVLEEIYEHDNSEFVDYLTRRGFYVASKSRSTYSQTFLSLASSLNMTYLDSLAAATGTESRSRRPAVNMIWYNGVSRFLKHYGYVTVAFSSGWWGTEITNADSYLAPRWQPDFFQRELIEMTPLDFIARQLGVQDHPLDFIAWQLGVQDQHAAHRERVLYTLDRLPEVAELDGPLFVFAHIVAPHPPFVFGPHGEEIEPESQFTLFDGDKIIGEGALTRDEYVRRYRDQVTFVNGRVEKAVDGILSRSARPAIIIVQADHGPASLLDWENCSNECLRERFSILNAYYLPRQGEADLYEGITPVNTFRVIFNRYFGTTYELLDDESYFSTYNRPYAFTNVSEQLSSHIGTETVE